MINEHDDITVLIQADSAHDEEYPSTFTQEPNDVLAVFASPVDYNGNYQLDLETLILCLWVTTCMWQRIVNLVQKSSHIIISMINMV